VQYHVSYALNTMSFVYNGSLETSPYGLYSLFNGESRRGEDVKATTSTAIFIDGSIARSWTHWVDYASTSLEQESFHQLGRAVAASVDGHVEVLQCEPGAAAYHLRTPWSNPEQWYNIYE